MRKLFCVLSVLSIFSALSAAGPDRPDYVIDSRRILTRAQTAFDAADYGAALKLAEEAKTARKRQIEWEVSTLRNSFKPAEVKYAGDTITDILPVLERREDFDAIEIIRRYEKIKGRDFFEDSPEKLIGYIQSVRAFPEADSLAGDVYIIEGEYTVAEQYYTAALDSASVLDIPDEKIDILYKLADISRLQGETEKYEQNLLLIAAADTAFTDGVLYKAMLNTVRDTDSGCIEKFFRLYRVKNTRLISAYTGLAELYQAAGAEDKALRAGALAAITGFTKLYDVIRRRTPEFEYSDFASLLSETARHGDLVDWGNRNNVWKGFNLFAAQAFRNGCPVFARELYTALSEHSPESYWREEAAAQLKEISVPPEGDGAEN